MHGHLPENSLADPKEAFPVAFVGGFLVLWVMMLCAYAGEMEWEAYSERLRETTVAAVQSSRAKSAFVAVMRFVFVA